LKKAFYQDIILGASLLRRVRLSVTSPQVAALPSGLSTAILRAGGKHPSDTSMAHRPSIILIIQSKHPEDVKALIQGNTLL
jgi:hypothetical protein